MEHTDAQREASIAVSIMRTFFATRAQPVQLAIHCRHLGDDAARQVTAACNLLFQTFAGFYVKPGDEMIAQLGTETPSACEQCSALWEGSAPASEGSLVDEVERFLRRGRLDSEGD